MKWHHADSLDFGLCAVPAEGFYTHFAIPAGSYSPAEHGEHIRIIADLREGRLHELNLRSMNGLVSFPSVHAASALLFIWAARPIRALFWPMVAVNSAMLIATPIEGNHYFSDLIPGFGIALLAIKVSGARRMKIPLGQTRVAAMAGQGI